MVRTCYLCHRDAKCQSIHRFPKNPVIRRKWMEACGLSPLDDVSHLHICSRHFRNEDITKIPMGHRPRLNPGSVPSINVKTSRVRDGNELPSTVKRRIPFIEGNNLPQTTLVNTPIQPTSPKFIDTERMEYQLRSENVMIDPLLLDESIFPVKSENMNANDDTMDMQSLPENIESNPSCSGSKEFCTPPKRRFAEPRYISEISVSDVATPKRARQIINFVKRINMEKTKQIKRLQDKNRKLSNRIVTLQKMMSNLRGKRLISEKTEDT